MGASSGPSSISTSMKSTSTASFPRPHLPKIRRPLRDRKLPPEIPRMGMRTCSWRRSMSTNLLIQPVLRLTAVKLSRRLGYLRRWRPRQRYDQHSHVDRIAAEAGVGPLDEGVDEGWRGEELRGSKAVWGKGELRYRAGETGVIKMVKSDGKKARKPHRRPCNRATASAWSAELRRRQQSAIGVSGSRAATQRKSRRQARKRVVRKARE